MLGLLAAATLAWYLVYTEMLVRQLRRETAVQGRIYGRILRGLADPRDGAAEAALFDLPPELK